MKTGLYIIILAALILVSFMLWMRWRLKVKEHPAEGSKRLILFLTGDGGYSKMAKKVCRLLQAHHYHVIAWDTRYFWGGRTLNQATKAFERVVCRAGFPQKAQQISVIGFSFGADITPFIVNHISPTLQHQLSDIVLLSPSRSGEFRIDLVTLLFPAREGTLNVLQEINQIQLPTTVILNDNDSLLETDFIPAISVKRLPGNHHFDHNYPQLVKTILETIEQH